MNLERDGHQPREHEQREGDDVQPGQHGGQAFVVAGEAAEALGLRVWFEDEAGPFQASPHPGVSWQPESQPAHTSVASTWAARSMHLPPHPPSTTLRDLHLPRLCPC